MKKRKALDNILFATDLSEESAHAIHWLQWFRSRSRSNAYIVHVLDLLPGGVGAKEIAKARAVAERQFANFLRKHSLNRKPFTPMLVVGDGAAAIAAFVKKHEIALVVLGSQGTGLHRFFRGSVSEEVFRSVDCLVLTVGPHAKSAPRPGGIKRVLFATDLDKPSASVLGHLRFLLEGNSHSTLTLAHFLSKESKSIVERHGIRKKSREKLVSLVPSGLRDRIGEVVVECYPPAKGILAWSRNYGADLIVLAVRDAGPLTRLATHRTRSITHQIIQSATCPVLTIRA